MSDSVIDRVMAKTGIEELLLMCAKGLVDHKDCPCGTCHTEADQ